MGKTSRSLIDLIDVAAQRHGGASGRRLAELAQHAGHDISHATLNRLRQGTYATRPSDASIRAIAFLADVSENTAFAAAGVRAPTTVAYEPPREAQRMSTRQRKALDELIRAFATEPAATTLSGVDLGGLLAARERLNVALAGTGGVQQLRDAAREVMARIDEVTDAVFAAASDQDAANCESCLDGATSSSIDDPAHATG
jgi:pyruvate/2-oxoglutarate dehydrogenase complex dihydrolipoamide acyltransferase (E2) component